MDNCKSKSHPKKTEIDNSSPKRVFARQLSSIVVKAELEKISGGKGGWYETNTEKVKGLDCCK